MCMYAHILHARTLFVAIAVNKEGIELTQIPTDAKLMEMAEKDPFYVAQLLNKVGLRVWVAPMGTMGR